MLPPHRLTVSLYKDHFLNGSLMHGEYQPGAAGSGYQEIYESRGRCAPDGPADGPRVGGRQKSRERNHVEENSHRHSGAGDGNIGPDDCIVRRCGGKRSTRRHE